MSKKKKTKSRVSTPAKAQPRSGTAKSDNTRTRKGKGPMSRRSVLKSAALAGVAIAAGAGIHYFDSQNKELHDLSAIGAGAPVVVQVHDPSCPSCRQLMRATKSALQDITQLKYRVADLGTHEGQELAGKYGVGKVTLLLFDGRGKHLNTIQGVQSAQNLRAAFTRQFSL